MVETVYIFHDNPCNMEKHINNKIAPGLILCYILRRSIFRNIAS